MGGSPAFKKEGKDKLFPESCLENQNSIYGILANGIFDAMTLK